MGTLTIRNLDDDVKQKLRERAAERGVSMEQEVRESAWRTALSKSERSEESPSWRICGAWASKPKRAVRSQEAISDEMWDEGLH